MFNHIKNTTDSIMAVFLTRAGKFGENENYFLDNNIICMVWQELSEVDLSNIKTQEQLKEIMIDTYQDRSKSIPNWISQIWIHLKKMQVGDLIVLPLKNSRKIAIGKIISDYIFDEKRKPYSHIRRVEWIEKEIPRTAFDQDLLYSFGAFKTFCEINRNDVEARIKALLSGKKNATNNNLKHPLENIDGDKVNLEESSLDQISNLILSKFKGKKMESLVESIFKAKGYFTYASPAGADGGVDILAAKGDLGFENPKICIQVKSGSAVGIDILDRLSGTMKKVKADFGLLVSWEGFNKGKIKEEKRTEFFTIRLWEQKELVEEFLKYYDKLDEEIKSEIPLKQIWIIADGE